MGAFSKSIKSFIVVSLLATSSVVQADEAPPGIFLCPSPLLARDFWVALNAVGDEHGIKVTRDIATQVAAKNKCKFFASTDFSPVSAGWNGMLKMTNDNDSGWVAPGLYNIYVKQYGKK